MGLVRAAHECDLCGTSRSGDERYPSAPPDGWLVLRRSPVGRTLSFCTWACLSIFAGTKSKPATDGATEGASK